MKNGLFIFLVLILFLLMSPVYSFVYINEIKFKGDEFVEIYSNETLNLTEMKVYDKDLNTNTLSLLKNFSSNYTLIIGKNFKSNELNNISSLNCTIYVTSGAQVLHGGAPNSGENLIIQINNETNISWIKNKNFSFKDEETLNFNYENKNYYVSNSTPCLPNLELEQMQNHSNNSLNKTEQLSQIPQNDSNTPQNQSEDLTSCQDYTFEIIPVPEGEIFDSKIQYKFETNAEENYSISYWIESYRGDIVRSKRETTNTNTKSYTPRDFTQIYRIKAYLEYRGCKIEDERVVSFYSDNEEDIEEEDDTSDTYTDDESYIKIPNENDILNHRTNELVYEIYRGDTSKRTVYFYLNSDKISQTEIGKYSKVKGRIKLSLNNSRNVITISGLDEKEVITIPSREDEINEINSTLEDDAKDTKEKQYFNLTSLRVNNSVLIFEIYTNLDSYEGDCYTRYVRTKVSNVYNITQNVSEISLLINISKLEEKEKRVSYNLSLICKYKKSDLKTFKYVSESFIFSVNEDSKSGIMEFENDSILLDSTDENGSSTLSSEKGEGKEVEDDEIVFESQNEKTKLKSQYFILLGLSSLLGIMLFKW